MSFFKSYTILIILIFMSAYNINANTDIKDDLEYLKPKEKHKIGIGGGFIYKPTYVGSSSIRTVWFPTITYQYNNPEKEYFNSFDLFGPFASLSVYDSNILSFNLIGEYDFGRQSGDDNSLETLEDIDPHFNMGFDFAYKIPFNLSLDLEYQTGVSDPGTENTVSFSLTHNKLIWVNFAQPLINKASISMNYGNSEWMEEWFSTPSTSKFSKYTAKSGFYSTSISNMSVIPAGESMSFFVNIEYERLRGNAADSPLVKDQGSKHQYMFMFAIVFEIAKF